MTWLTKLIVACPTCLPKSDMDMWCRCQACHGLMASGAPLVVLPASGRALSAAQSRRATDTVPQQARAGACRWRA